MGLYDFTLYNLIRRNKVAFPQLPAWLETGDGRLLTFADIGTTVERLAAGLQRTGIRKGDRIGVLGKNCLEYFLLFGAAGAIGAVILPVNWRLSEEEIVYIVNDAAPAILFVDYEYHAHIQSFRHRLTSVESCFNLNSNRGQFEDFDTLIGSTAVLDFDGITETDDLAIIHTAAVDGRPRGAVLTHRNFVNASIHLNLLMHLGPKDVHLNVMPLFHVGGLFMALASFHGGALNVNMPKFDAIRAGEIIEREGVTVLLDFAPTLKAIMETVEADGRSLASLRHVIGLDAAETIEAYQQLTGGTFYTIYGQTETSAIVTLGRYADRPGSAGRNVPLANVRLVDDEDRPVPVGDVGEITVRGPLVFNRYWNAPEETKHVFRNGWHHTGDMGRFDQDGFLFYSGRKPEKELIKTGGENVYPAEVEAALMAHPEVKVAVVFGAPDSKWGEAVCAACELFAGSTLREFDLQAYVATQIASHKKPRRIQFVRKLPLLEDSRIDKEAVKKGFQRWRK